MGGGAIELGFGPGNQTKCESTLSVMLAVGIVCRREILSILAAAFTICVYTAGAKRSLEHM